MKSLGEYLSKLEEVGELVEVKEPLSVELEAPFVAAKTIEEGGPALKFTNLKGFEGFSLAAGLYSGPDIMQPFAPRKTWKKFAVALGLSPNIRYEELQSTFNDRVMREIKPVEVASGPCKEKKIVNEEDIDLLSLPFPKIHATDGGRYGCRYPLIMKDPRTGWQYQGPHRWQIISKNTIAVNIPKDSLAWKIIDKYEGKPVPVAISIGGTPTIDIACSLFLTGRGIFAHEGVDIYTVAGSLALDSIELVKAETSDLLVPAHAELVLEGELLPNETAMEGPFPNFYRVEPPSPQPVVRIKAVTHRTNPIIPFVPEGVTGNDTETLIALTHAAEIKFLLDVANHRTVYFFFPREARLSVGMVGAKIPYRGYAYQLANYIFANTKWIDKLFIVDATYLLDDEYFELLNDIFNKAHPFDGWRVSDEDAAIPYSCKYPTREGLTARLYVNANFDPLWPKEWIGLHIAFEDCYAPEVQQKVLEKWKKIFPEVEPIVIKREERILATIEGRM